MNWANWRQKLAYRELTVHFLFFCVDSNSVILQLLVSPKVLLPALFEILKCLRIPVLVHQEHSSVKVHFFELEDVFSVVAVKLQSIKFLLFCSWERRILWNTLHVRFQLVYNQTLFNFNLGHVWDYLDWHWAVFFFQVEVLVLLELGDHWWNLSYTVVQDLELLLLALFIWLVVVTFWEGKRSDTRKQLEKDFEVEIGELLIWGLVLAKLHLLESPLEIRQGAKTSYSLKAGQWGLLDSVGVVKCFDCIGVGTSSHKQVSGMNMDHRVLLVRDD